MVDVVTILLVVALVIQYLVERVKDFIPNDVCNKIFKYVKPSVFSLVFALIISFGCQINLFDYIGITINPVWLGYALTAIALSGGSVAVNELIKSLASIKDNNNVSANITQMMNNFVDENKETINKTDVDYNTKSSTDTEEETTDSSEE